jgi:hypothetical protein
MAARFSGLAVLVPALPHKIAWGAPVILSGEEFPSQGQPS